MENVVYTVVYSMSDNETPPVSWVLIGRHKLLIKVVVLIILAKVFQKILWKDKIEWVGRRIYYRCFAQQKRKSLLWWLFKVAYSIESQVVRL